MTRTETTQVEDGREEQSEKEIPEYNFWYSEEIIAEALDEADEVLAKKALDGSPVLTLQMYSRQQDENFTPATGRIELYYIDYNEALVVVDMFDTEFYRGSFAVAEAVVEKMVKTDEYSKPGHRGGFRWEAEEDNR